jgi:plasmid segregation protein ParM
MNRHPKLMGLDIGFGFTKCIDGEQAVIFTSRMRPYPEAPEAPPEGYLVDIDKARFAIGHEGHSEELFEDFARGPERLLDGFAKGLTLTAAAHYAEQEAPLQIVLGLPISEAQRWQGILTERLIGYHKIGLASGHRPWVQKNVHIRKIHVVPHPLGTFINLIMDHEGRHRNAEVQHQKVALVDIGFRTTDIMVMEAGRFCNRGSATLGIGMADGLQAIARKLHREKVVIPDVAHFYRAVGLGHMRIGDQAYNLNSLRDQIYQQLAATLADRINDRLREHWDLERLLLTGGGAVDLADRLAALLHGEVDLIEHEQDVRLSNAQGYLSLAKHMWGGSGLCTRHGTP